MDFFKQLEMEPSKRMISALELQPSAFGQICEADVEAAWSAEIERRLVEIDAGTVELIPWDDVRLELFGESEWRE